VNTGGIDMRESEIFEALYGAEGEKPIRSAVSRLVDLDFGMLDEDLFLRCLRVTCGPSVRVASESPDKLPHDSISRTESAIRRAVRSIKIAAGIPHWKLLPYRLPLIYLTAFYDRFPSDDGRIDRLVAKWIWRGALSGDHENVSDGRVDRLVKSMRKANSAGESLSALLKAVDMSSDFEKLPNNPMRELDKKISLGRASGKVFILALLAANPRRSIGQSQPTLWEADTDFFEHSESSVESSSLPELDPTRIYWSLTDEGNFGSDTVVKVPEMRKKEILSGDTETLRSFLISHDAVALLQTGRIPEFRACRKAILNDWFNEFISDRIGDRVDLRPPIQTIINRQKPS
jgi:hypothetical protein